MIYEYKLKSILYEWHQFYYSLNGQAETQILKGIYYRNIKFSHKMNTKYLLGFLLQIEIFFGLDFSVFQMPHSPNTGSNRPPWESEKKTTRINRHSAA